MSITKRFALALAVVLAAGLAPVWIPSAQAQELEVKGPLAGAPAVIGLRVYREMRFQAQLHAAMTLQDEYSRAVFGGLQLNFHPTDWLGIGAWGAFALAQLDTALTEEIQKKGQTNDVNVLSLPAASGFPDQIANIKFVAAPQVTFIPLRGKLGIFESLFVDTDFYVFGGVAFVGLEERADVDSAACAGQPDLGGTITCLRDGQGSAAAQDDRQTRSTVAPTFGAGLSMYMADFLAMTLEWRALPFAWNTSGTDESGSPFGDFPDGKIDEEDQLSHFNHMFVLGFAFYLPTEPSLSHMDTE